ncbi:unnamed protein product [Bathycoccus prasinos]
MPSPSLFTCDESSLYGSDMEKHVVKVGIGNSPTVTQVNYFRNRTDDDDNDDEPASIALVSIVANEPLRATTSGANLNNTGTTKFTVSKVHSSKSSRKIACIFTPEREGESASYSLSESAKKYVTECIFKQFSEDNEKLFRIDGTCEIFCPMNGTNTGWHRDGFQRGCYVGHALCEEEREDTAVADDVYRADDAADDGAAWFEFALIKKEDTKGESDATPSIDFCDSEHLLVQPSNFVAFAARNAVSIFEDSKIFHRSPRIESCWDAMERGRRKIARFDFVGRDAENNVVLWKMKKNKEKEKALPRSSSSSSSSSAGLRPPRRFAFGRRLLLLRQSREKLDAKEEGEEIDVDDFARYVNDASSRPRY